MMREIESEGEISSIISRLSDLFPNTKELWLRGQSNYNYCLLPSIFRQGDGYENSYDEAGMYHEFIRRYPEHSLSHRSVYDWLTLMQHYGLPTRLLDWTTNLLVALYFCCENRSNDDAAIFVFDPSMLLKKSEEYNFIEIQILSKDIVDFYANLIRESRKLLVSPIKINGYTIDDINSKSNINVKFTNIAMVENFTSFKVIKRRWPLNDLEGNGIEKYEEDCITAFSNVIPFKSPQLNSRIKAQHGLFTIHGGKYFSGNEFIKCVPMERNQDLDNHLTKIKIKSSDKAAIMYELELSGIRKATLFPEMEHQAEEIKKLFTS